MTLPLRIVHASATAADEQSCAAAIRPCGIIQQIGTETAKRRTGHHRHAVLLAPWQEVLFDAAVGEVVKDLIGRTAIALWNTE